MSKITGIKKGKARRARINVFLDGKPAIKLLPETVLKENLKRGEEISETRLEELAIKDLRQRCFNTAARFIGYRPRSEAEIRQRLAHRGFDADTIEKTVAKLEETGLADDGAFARFWIENREMFRPRSRRLAKLELKRKGLKSDVIDEAVSILDDRENARRAAAARTQRLAGLDYQEFRRRLGQYLARRGFSYEIVKETLERAWKEQGGKTA